ncbi:dynein regulatry complex protein 1, partial [Paragonimus westermani]
CFINITPIFFQLTERWLVIRSSQLPQDTRDVSQKYLSHTLNFLKMLIQQKNECADLVNEKNKLISELNLEIKAKDDHYVRELKKRTDDIDLLAERMESQIQAMQKLYREELVAIENSLVAQKDKLLAEQNSEWEALMAEIKQKQINYLDEHFVRVEEFEKELDDLRIKHSEEYNSLKISLESEVETLEAQLLQLKATYQLNLEKLEYNFQVLKRRDEENMITKSNQKRKITRMLDTLNSLHVKANKQEKQYSMENEQLSEDYKRRMENFSDLQKKSKLFIEAEHRNFRDIWVMNEEALKQLTNRLLEAHRVINEQQLGLPWTKPDLQDTRIDTKSNSKSVPTSLREVSPEVVRDFLQLLCYEPALGVQNEEDLDYLFTHFITQPEKLTMPQCVDKRLTKVIRLIEPSTKFTTEPEDTSEFETQPVAATGTLENEPLLNSEEDHVTSFVSIDVAVATDVPRVSDFEEPAQQEEPTCSGKHISIRTGRTSENVGDSFDSKHAGTRWGLDTEAKHASITEMTDGTMFTHSDSADKREDHGRTWELIAPVNVVDILHKFTVNMQRRDQPRSQGTVRVTRKPATDRDRGIKPARPESRPSMYDYKSFSSSPAFSYGGTTGMDTDKRDDSYDADYWNKYATAIVNSETEKVWDNLYVALQRYLCILKHRAKLIRESDALRKQNAELRHLLQQYLNAPVNYELQVPPAKVMQLK